MNVEHKELIATTSSIVCGVCAVWMAFNLFFPVGWSGSIEYLNYRFQFQEVHQALINCSAQNGFLEAQLQGSITRYHCVLHASDLLAPWWNATTVMT